MYKRIIALALCTLLISSSLFSFASPSQWAEEAVVWLKYSEIIPRTLFSDETEQIAITREQFCELAVRLYATAKGESVDQLGYELPFKDTSSLMVGRAYHLGIVKGLSGDTFGPLNKITREQLATMLYRELKLLGIPGNYTKGLSFADDLRFSTYAVDAIYFCQANNLVKGVGQNKFAPQNNTTIEQAQLIIFNILKRYQWSNPIPYSVQIAYHEFLLPIQTDISVSIDKGNDIDLRLVLPVRGTGANWTAELNQLEVYGILRSNKTLPYVMAESALLQIHSLWDSTLQRYLLSEPFYITQTGEQTKTVPTQKPYLYIQSQGTMMIDVQLP